MDWVKLANREIPPPWAPPVKEDKKDLGNFDSAFTNADPTMTPEDPAVIKKIGQMNHMFHGFSFVNLATGAFKGEGGEDLNEEPQYNSKDLRRFKWYRPDISREDMGKALKPLPSGAFFIRESSSQLGCYALSVSTGGGKRWNGLITPTVDNEGQTKYRLYVTHKFDSFEELLDYYTKKAVTKTDDGRDVFLVLP